MSSPAFTDYEVLWNTNVHDLVDEVNRYLADGYVPVGGIDGGGGAIAFYQAVARPALPAREVTQLAPPDSPPAGGTSAPDAADKCATALGVLGGRLTADTLSAEQYLHLGYDPPFRCGRPKSADVLRAAEDVVLAVLGRIPVASSPPG